MTETPTQILSLEEFLKFDDGSDFLYELENGKLRVLRAESFLHGWILSSLFVFFHNYGLPITHLRLGGTEVIVPGNLVTVRVPDFMILSDAGAIALKGASRSTIFSDMPVPEIVVEVVSPGRENTVRDYRHKRAQYQARGIQEYWIVDPQAEKITILTLNEWLYDEAVFTKDQAIASAFLENLNVESYPTVAEILQMEND